MAKTKSLSRPTYAEISIANMSHNFRYLKSLTQNPFFCPMVKADAYGHDLELIVPQLISLGVQYLGVATIEEAIAVRSLNQKVEVLVFSSCYKNVNDLLRHYNITPVVGDMQHIKDLVDISVHLKINTGMNRMGIHEAELNDVMSLCKQNRLEIKGVLSHFYEGETLATNDSSAKKQLDYFRSILNEQFHDVEIQHLYNSDSLLADKGASGFGARPGIALYGYSSNQDQELKPVLRLVSKIVKLHDLKEGESVSYGATWKAKKESRIAVLAIGYADGLSRAFSNQYRFLCHNEEVAQIGNICMDYTMVDITNIRDKVSLYDPICILGAKPEQVYNIASEQNTIPYEVLTNISNRVPKILVDNF